MPVLPKKPKALVLGNYRQTLTVIRSLGNSGYDVIVGRTGRRSFTDYSRHTSEVWDHPDIREKETEFIAALAEFLSIRGDVALIFPVGDTQISCLSRHQDQIASDVAMAMPDPLIVAACQDKTALYDMSAQLRMAQTGYCKAYSYDELLSGAAGVGYPCVVKPRDSFALLFNEKAVIVRSVRELTDSIPVWPDGHQCLIVQKYAPGYRHTCQFLAHDGEILSCFDYKVLRTDRPNDTGYAVDAVSVQLAPNLRENCDALVKRLQYSGIGSAQFLVDEDTGSVCFLEINPRLGAACGLPFYCGYDFPRMAVEYALYTSGARAGYDAVVAYYPSGRRAAWLMGDLEAMLRDLKSENGGFRAACRRLIRMLNTQLAGDFHLTWSWNDPLPTCYIFARRALSLLRIDRITRS